MLESNDENIHDIGHIFELKWSGDCNDGISLCIGQWLDQVGSRWLGCCICPFAPLDHITSDNFAPLHFSNANCLKPLILKYFITLLRFHLATSKKSIDIFKQNVIPLNFLNSSRNLKNIIYIPYCVDYPFDSPCSSHSNRYSQ